MKLVFALCISAFIFYSCESSTSKTADVKTSEFKINFETPEQLVKSYWKSRIFIDTIDCFDSTNWGYDFYTPDTREVIKVSFNKNLAELKSKHYKSASVIDKIEQQTPERVVVYTKEYDWSEDTEFNIYKYSIIRAAGTWKIENIESRCTSCNGTGIDEYYKTKCTLCNGLGWNSRFYN